MTVKAVRGEGAMGTIRSETKVRSGGRRSRHATTKREREGERERTRVDRKDIIQWIRRIDGREKTMS